MSITDFFKRLFPQQKTTLPPRPEFIESIRQGLQDGSLHIRAVYGIAIDRDTRPSGYDDKRLLELYWSIRKGREPEEELIRIIKQADREFWNKLKAESQKNKQSKPKKSRPAIRLRKRPERQKSKLGGNPNLPDSIAWPVNPQGIPLDFLAQIYCPDLPGGLGLPDTGTLFFFYDAEEMPWEGEGEEKRHRAVIYTLESLPETVRNSGGRPPFGEVFLTFEQMETFPPDDDSFEENDDNDAVECGAHHQMLGYPVYIQDEDMAPGKILLLQLDTDDDTGWMWGDMGMIYFWIAPQELDARNFDDVRLILECH